MRRTYFNINYEPLKEKVYDAIDGALAQGGKPGYICVADGNILTMVHKNPEYRAVVNGSMCSIVDSSWVPLLYLIRYFLQLGCHRVCHYK